jgi:uncharacterized protein
MAFGFDPRATATPQSAGTIGREGIAYDAGLRSYMLSVYNYMASGVLLTGIVAVAMAYSGAVRSLFDPVTGGPSVLAYVLMFVPLGVGMWMIFGFNRMKVQTAKTLFWLYAGLLGASLSTIFVVYTASSVAQTFFATSAAFASLSLWGYTTKKDLSGWASFLLIGLVGLLFATAINIFWPSGPMGFTISIVGVLIFAGLTAYHTQEIKSMYFTVRGTPDAEKYAVMGAFKLYLDFINMFLYLLRLMGSRD